LSTWINCKNKLPEHCQECLVYGILENSKTYEILKAHYFKNINMEQGRDEFWESEWCYDIYNVMYWMELPPIPEESN